MKIPIKFSSDPNYLNFHLTPIICDPNYLQNSKIRGIIEAVEKELGYTVSGSTIKNAIATLKRRTNETSFDLIPQLRRNGGYRVQFLRDANVISHGKIEPSSSLVLHAATVLDHRTYQEFLKGHPFIHQPSTFDDLSKKFDNSFGVLARVRIANGERIALQAAFVDSALLGTFDDLFASKVSLGSVYETMQLGKREQVLQAMTCSLLEADLLRLAEGDLAVLDVRQLTFGMNGKLVEELHGLYTRHYHFRFVTRFGC
ncbi:MAG: UTRA domain-containing protein [Pseudomonadales bacterium]